MTTFENTLEFAQLLDTQDPLRSLRDEFLIPPHHEEQLIYLVGNSLGLQPKRTKGFIEIELSKWQSLGVESWFDGPDPWIPYLRHIKSPLGHVVGALPEEVTVMNSLTVNLHLLMVSFYQPTPSRFKILTEGGAFPSDQYAFETHLRSRGIDPDEALIELFPRSGEHTLRTEDILASIDTHADQLAMVLMGGINYYTGQFFDLEKISQQAQKHGITVGFDLAHVAGNIPLSLHQWGVDFAVWCSYKYLNSGPGAVAGAFVHQKHHAAMLPRFAGWWGYDEATRFGMTKGFKPMQGADGWQVSTPPILLMACHRAALEIFEKAGMDALRRKSEQLTAYLEYLIRESNLPLQIITPSAPHERGCQLSLLTPHYGKELFEYLVTQGILGDWREPNVIRMAPVPLYNTFEEVWRVGQALSSFKARP